MSFQTTFKTTEELRAFVSVDKSFDIDRFLPELDDVEKKYLAPAVSKEEYNALILAYHANTMSAAQTSLLQKFRAITANLAISQYADTNYNKSNTGIKNINAQNEKQLWEWQKRGMQDVYWKRGMDNIDICLAFMEENKADYPLWEASTAYTISKAHFINTASEFSGLVRINNSRSLFMRLLPTMTRVEDFKVKSVTCEALFNEIKTQQQAGTLTSQNEAALQLIKKAIVHYTIAEAIFELPILLSEDGIFTITDDTDEISKAQKPAENSKLSRLEIKHTQVAEAYLGQLRTLLQTNSEIDYPAYFGSSCYSATATNYSTRNNIDKKTYRL